MGFTDLKYFDSFSFILIIQKIFQRFVKYTNKNGGFPRWTLKWNILHNIQRKKLSKTTRFLKIYFEYNS